jgi:predicted nucleic acid-binding protein
MTGRAFFDANILIYADDVSAPGKRERAISLIVEHQRRNSCVVSLHKCCKNTSPLPHGSWGGGGGNRATQGRNPGRSKVVRFTERDAIAAIELHRLIRISFWDAMIVHAARAANAAVLYSEDLGHGSVLAGVTVRNPFLGV